MFPEGALAARSWGGALLGGGGSENIAKELSTRRAVFREVNTGAPPSPVGLPLPCAFTHAGEGVSSPDSEGEGEVGREAVSGGPPAPPAPSCAQGPFGRPAEAPPKAQCSVGPSRKPCENSGIDKVWVGPAWDNCLYVR